VHVVMLPTVAAAIQEPCNAGRICLSRAVAYIGGKPASMSVVSYHQQAHAVCATPHT